MYIIGEYYWYFKFAKAKQGMQRQVNDNNDKKNKIKNQWQQVQMVKQLQIPLFCYLKCEGFLNRRKKIRNVMYGSTYFTQKFAHTFVKFNVVWCTWTCTSNNFKHNFVVSCVLKLWHKFTLDSKFIDIRCVLVSFTPNFYVLLIILDKRNRRK